MIFTALRDFRRGTHMCGRFAFLASQDDIRGFLPDVSFLYWPGPRYNIAPTQEIITVLNDGKRETSATRWGLVPSWAKDPGLGGRMINARLETLHEKPAFKRPFSRQRCVIPASGFFEWKTSEGKKFPYYIRNRDGSPLVFAGLYDRWRSAEGNILVTSAIITTTANSAILPVHDRMPLMMRPENVCAWLTQDEAPQDELMKLLTPIEAADIEAVPVSSLVNNSANDSVECIQPLK